jgi:Zn-dependent M16 (insulinase) family peptidase
MRITRLSYVFITLLVLSASAAADPVLESLQPDQQIASFRVENLYDNDAGKAIGARFRHVKSGCILDFLRIQSVPQAYMWVNTPAPSDMGEPHTCEHLLLGKGNKGRYVASLEDMSMGSSSAGTYRLHTDYHFHTTAGGDVFYELLEAKLDAMLHPDFTDEEIRREVCNMGVVVNPEDSSLSFEEKGTVYTEMVSSFERPGSIMWKELCLVTYGKGHPCSNVSGGTPEGIRRQTPRDLREFHRKAYTLSNMGIIASIPDEYELNDFLARVSDIFDKVEPDVTLGLDPGTAEDRLPAPKPFPEGTKKRLEFPHQNENEPGLVVFVWPPTLAMDVYERAMLNLFLSNLSQGQTSNLYKKFFDSQTRVLDIGTGSVSGGLMFDVGNPMYFWFSNIKREALEDTVVDSIRTVFLAEIKRIADFPDGSEALGDFNDRAQNRILQRRRQIRKFLSTPPRFGYRGISNSWQDYFKQLQKREGFRKDLAAKDVFEFAESKLQSDENIWREYIAKWNLLDIEPCILTAVANPDIFERENAAKENRIDRFVESLESQYGVASADEAIRRYSEYYDEKTAEIKEEAGKIEMPGLVDNPPMTYDDQLDYRIDNLPGGGPLVISSFETMTGASVGIALRMDGLPEEYHVYVASLPTLLSEVGVIKDGQPISYDEMRERMRQEILWAHAGYSTSYTTERIELTFECAGSNSEESIKAMDWLELIMFNPDWRVENLPRIKDAIDLQLSNLRNTMKGGEESWVSGPAAAYRKQENPLLLRSSCFLTQTHDVQRLSWLLKGSDDSDVIDQVEGFMNELSAFGTGRDNLMELLTMLSTQPDDRGASDENAAVCASFDGLSESARELVSEAVDDLMHNLSEIPDNSLEADWKYLCSQIASDLKVVPADVLADLHDALASIERQGNARSYVVSNSAVGNAIVPKIASIVSALSTEQSVIESFGDSPTVKSRFAQRTPDFGAPVYVGLINENTRNGVFVNSAKCASIRDFDHDGLLRFLAARLYGGGGAHSMFMKTWSAGLAYSNGLRSGPSSGRLSYYAERCPDLAQTMQFVVDELKSAPYDPSLSDYAVAQVFQSSRAGSNYEHRGTAMAADLADGLTAEKVRSFREAVLEISSMPHLYDTLHANMLETYGQVLPGLDPPGSAATDAVYFIIGPESQFQSFEEYLRSVEGEVRVARLYPRDFWIPGPSVN